MTQLPSKAALDVTALWDFHQPALSEQRFRDALAGAQGDERLILQTQIARTWGLRSDFEQARGILAQVEAQLPQAGAEARVRHALELGRSWASPKHAPEQRTDATRERARSAFERALTMARSAQLDALAIDAVHMLAFIDTAPADQLAWAREALALVLASKQPAAQRWEASIRNNLGVALHALGRLDEALSEFETAVALRRQAGNPRAEREARWMVAWTLRSLKRSDEALAMQQQLEAENDAAGMPDGYVIDELATLYRERGDNERADRYAARRATLPK